MKSEAPPLHVQLYDLLALAIPNMVSYTQTQLPEAINIIMIGNFGSPIDIGGVGLGLGLMNVFHVMLAQGIASVMDYYVTTTFGAGQYLTMFRYVGQ